MKSSVTISLVPEAKGGPFVFWDDLGDAIRQAAQIGFDAIEIFAPGPDAIDVIELRRLLQEHRLKLAAMGTGAGWVLRKLTLTSADPAVREQAEAFIRSIIDRSGPLGAPAIIGSMQGRWGDGVSKSTALGWLGESLQRLGEHAHRYDVPLLYEPLNRYETNLLTTIDDAAQFLEATRASNVRLLADLFHMNIEEISIPAALRAGRAHIGHIHFVDSNRRPAGLGHIDYQPIADALREIDYRGYLSAEAFAYPDPRSAAEQTMATYRRFFS